MKKLIVLLGISLILVLSAAGQTADKTITIQKKKFYQSGKVVPVKELKSILYSNPASAPEYKKSKMNSNIGMPFMIAGTGLILAGTAITLAGTIQEAKDLDNNIIKSSYPNGLGLVIAGAALDIISIPFLISANKHFRSSIDHYNSAAKATGRLPVQINMIVSSNRVGLKVVF